MGNRDRFPPWPEWTADNVDAGTGHARYLAQTALKSKEPPRGAELPPIDELGICGAGIMGTGIAAAAIQHGVSVRLFDVDATASQRAAETLSSYVFPSSSTPKPRIHICSQQREIAQCPLVLETVIEEQQLKQSILADLATHMNDGALLASNTSTIPIAKLGAELPHPERFFGLHFCNPVAHRKLVEIVQGTSTTDSTVAAAARFVAGIGKLPVVAQDCPGFLVNRLLLPYVNEALNMVCQGEDIVTIDRVAQEFGMALGPMQMLDMVGTDVAYRAGKMMWQASPSRVSLTPILPALVKRKRLGQKVGVGFYRYDTPEALGKEALGKEALEKFDPEIEKILSPYVRHPKRFEPDEIRAWLFLPMLLEATRVLEEGVVKTPGDVDLAVIHGLAFPEFRGGLIYWADTLGWEKIADMMAPLAQLGERMSPTTMLRALSASRGKLYHMSS